MTIFECSIITNTHIMLFSKETIEIILQGGEVIDYYQDRRTGLNHILIRMPKGKPYIHSGNPFEFVACYNSPEHFGDVTPMRFRNGHVSTVKRQFGEDYREERYYETKRIKQLESAKNQQS